MLEKGEVGIKDNYKLWICYDGVREDMQKLIDEGWVRVIDYSEKKEKKKEKKTKEPIKRMFFPRDIADLDLEYTKEQLPQNCHNFLADLWDKKVGDVKWEQTL